MMKRREFITLFGGAAAAWPLAAHAQQPDVVRRIGVLMWSAESDQEGQARVAAFREGLQQLGWTEGRNIRIDSRWGSLDDAELRRRSAREALQPDLILSHTTPTTTALLQQTRTIPIIFANVSDPVGSGFVESLVRPGGNATGLNVSEPTIAGKLLELLREIAPRVASVAMLFNPTTATYAEYWLNSFKAAAAALAVEAITKLATSPLSTGSPPSVQTIGMVVVAALAASGDGSPPVAAITVTGWLTNSAANAGSRSYRPSAQRYSIVTFLPSK
jgi:putative ABC transport system substrate-binding protein